MRSEDCPRHSRPSTSTSRDDSGRDTRWAAGSSVSRWPWLSTRNRSSSRASRRGNATFRTNASTPATSSRMIVTKWTGRSGWTTGAASTRVWAPTTNPKPTSRYSLSRVPPRRTLRAAHNPPAASVRGSCGAAVAFPGRARRPGPERIPGVCRDGHRGATRGRSPIVEWLLAWGARSSVLVDEGDHDPHVTVRGGVVVVLGVHLDAVAGAPPRVPDPGERLACPHRGDVPVERREVQLGVGGRRDGVPVRRVQRVSRAGAGGLADASGCVTGPRVADHLTRRRVAHGLADALVVDVTTDRHDAPVEGRVPGVVDVGVAGRGVDL